MARVVSSPRTPGVVSGGSGSGRRGGVSTSPGGGMSGTPGTGGKSPMPTLPIGAPVAKKPTRPSPIGGVPVGGPTKVAKYASRPGVSTRGTF